MAMAAPTGMIILINTDRIIIIMTDAEAHLTLTQWFSPSFPMERCYPFGCRL